jgi:glycogen(starch) synthase
VSYRVLYAAGPGNVIQAHKHWMANEDDPTQLSITFSSQFEEFCRDVGASGYIISYHEEKHIFHDGQFILEHRPKPMPNAHGIGYHASEILYGLSLLLTALRHQVDVAILDSGSTHYFVGLLFRLAGIRVVTVLHNTLWPSGYPPKRFVPRLIRWLDSCFFRWAATATIGVSPECIRQVEQLTRGRNRALFQMRPQYRREYFQDRSPPPLHDGLPLRILYAGRIIREKGVFDILEIAGKVESLVPNQVKWEICGTGSDLDELIRWHRMLNLDLIVSIRGWTSPHDLRALQTACHASIVPTRSGFREGLAMAAVEAVLAGRPVITSSVVPALELLKPACVEARTNDVDSYVKCILGVMVDRNRYRVSCEACPPLRAQFFDRGLGLRAVLTEVFSREIP